MSKRLKFKMVMYCDILSGHYCDILRIYSVICSMYSRVVL